MKERGWARFGGAKGAPAKRWCFFFFQAEGGIRVPLWSRGLGDLYKIQPVNRLNSSLEESSFAGLASISVNEVVATSLYRIADATLSPLSGPMGAADYASVPSRKAIERDGKLCAWTIPVILAAVPYTHRTLPTTPYVSIP